MSSSASVKQFPTITGVKTYLIDGVGSGGDYHNVEGGHWLVDSPIANPMSGYEKYKHSRTSWGINVLGSFCVSLTASDGTVGFATGFGGPPACWLVQHHLTRFLVGKDPRDYNLIWDQMYRATMFYGRKGLPVATISVVDLAIWDLLGKIRGEPVYKLIGGAAREEIKFYCTTCDPVAAKENGFWGAKVPLPYGPEDGHEGLTKNIEFLRRHREAVGQHFPLMVDCYMALTVPYVIQLATETLDLGINWWEEVLSPDDTDGYAQIKRALPQLKFTTGEHEYTRYGFRKLVEGRNLDILQPDVMWVGGLTELLRVTALASAYDLQVVPHASGHYSYHYVAAMRECPFQEYLAASPDGKAVLPVFGDLFVDEILPVNGRLEVKRLDRPGFGLTVNENARLRDATGVLDPKPQKTLRPPKDEEEEEGGKAGSESEKAPSVANLTQTMSARSNPSTTTSRPCPPPAAQLLKGRTILITGGATGIGLATARLCSRHGANISLNYYPASQSLPTDIPNLLALPGDISLPETSTHLVSETVKRFGRLDCLVANAGICQFSDFLDTPPEVYGRHMAVNLDGTYFAAQAAAKVMQPGSAIIAISSISALVGGAKQAHYTPTKAGVASLMQSLACALGPKGVRCNAVLPGTIRTGMNEEDLKGDKGVNMGKRVPLGRLGVPEDVAGVVVWLCCEELSGYVNGAQVLVDGGAFVNLQ